MLVSGALAGLVHGSANLIIVEPYLDRAIEIENQNLFASGIKDTQAFRAEHEQYREWQKGGQVLAGVILGISMGALFGIVFALSRKSLPAKNNVKKALILAGMMWCTVYFIPFLKYPANPPTVGDSETVMLRTILYVMFVAVSGLSAIGFYKMSKMFNGNKRIIGMACYAIFIGMAFMAMPENPDSISAPLDLVNEFRVASVLGVSVFWISMALILGVLWNHYKPHMQITQNSHSNSRDLE